MTTVTPICAKCVHYHSDDIMTETCEAFPDGIPADITEGESNHLVPRAGDHGIVFTPVEGFEHLAVPEEEDEDTRILGSATSGNYGHAGRPGEVGGSVPKGDGPIGSRHITDGTNIPLKDPKKIKYLVEAHGLKIKNMTKVPEDGTYDVTIEGNEDAIERLYSVLGI